MKAIIQQQDKATILTSEIHAGKHIVVAICEGNATVLGWDGKRYIFHLIGGNDQNTLLNGNGYAYIGNNRTIQSIVEACISYNGEKVEVFPKSEWKQALQWLIDNGK